MPLRHILRWPILGPNGPHVGEGRALWGPFIGALIPYVRALPSWPDCDPKALTPLEARI